MASPKIQFSAGDLEANIKERAVLDDRSPPLVAQRDLRRYYRVLRASLLAHQHAVEAVRDAGSTGEAMATTTGRPLRLEEGHR